MADQEEVPEKASEDTGGPIISEGGTTFDQRFQRVETQFTAGIELVFHRKLPRRKTAQEYKEYVLALIKSYDKKASFLKVIHHLLQIIIFVGAALVTTIIAIPEVPKLVPAIISGAVTIATAITNYYKFGERSHDLLLASRDMALEYNRFTTKRGSYKEMTTEQGLDSFMDRIEALLYDQTERSQAFEQSEEAQK